MLICLTHTMDSDGHCMQCHTELFQYLPIKALERQPHVGDKIGLITDAAGSVAYYIGNHDSNKPCTPNVVAYGPKAAAAAGL